MFDPVNSDFLIQIPFLYIEDAELFPTKFSILSIVRKSRNDSKARFLTTHPWLLQNRVRRLHIVTSVFAQVLVGLLYIRIHLCKATSDVAMPNDMRTSLKQLFQRNLFSLQRQIPQHPCIKLIYLKLLKNQISHI